MKILFDKAHRLLKQEGILVWRRATAPAQPGTESSTVEIPRSLQIYERVSSSPFTYDKNFITNYEKLAGESRFFPTPRTIGSPTDVRIGNDVWIGEGVSIAGNVSIGDGAVIAGESVVVKDVPPYTVYGGNPARFIKNRFDSEALISELQEIQWWRFNFYDFEGLDVINPERFVKQIKRMLNRKSIKPLVVGTISASFLYKSL